MTEAGWPWELRTATQERKMCALMRWLTIRSLWACWTNQIVTNWPTDQLTTSCTKTQGLILFSGMLLIVAVETLLLVLMSSMCNRAEVNIVFWATVDGGSGNASAWLKIFHCTVQHSGTLFLSPLLCVFGSMLTQLHWSYVWHVCLLPSTAALLLKCPVQDWLLPPICPLQWSRMINLPCIKYLPCCWELLVGCDHKAQIWVIQKASDHT